MYEKILENVKTTGDKEKLTDELEKLAESLFEEKGTGFESCLKNNIRSWVAELIRAEITENQKDPGTYLDGLKIKLAELKEISLTLAFEPSESSIDKFFFFVRENVGKDLILDIKYEPRILGGAIVVFEGVYRDLSLKRLYDSEFLRREKDLLTLIFKKGQIA